MWRDRGKERGWQKAEGEKSRWLSLAAIPEVTITLFPLSLRLKKVRCSLPLGVLPPTRTAPAHSECSRPLRVLPPIRTAPAHSDCSHIGGQRDYVGRENQDILEGLHIVQRCDICLADGGRSEALGKLRSREEAGRGSTKAEDSG